MDSDTSVDDTDQDVPTRAVLIELVRMPLGLVKPLVVIGLALGIIYLGLLGLKYGTPYLMAFGDAVDAALLNVYHGIPSMVWTIVTWILRIVGALIWIAFALSIWVAAKQRAKERYNSGDLDK